jgi:MFS family permease
MVVRFLRSVFGRILPVQPFSPSDRAIAGLMSVVGMVQGYVQAQAFATLPFTRVALGLTAGDMSLVMAFTRIASFGALAFSLWGDRFGRKRPFLGAYLLLVLAGTATAGVGFAWEFATAQAAVRLATAAVTSLGIVLIAEQISPAVRAYGISIYGAAGSVGAGLALAALPLADMGPNGWRLPFALGLVGLAAIPFLRRRLGESAVFAGEAEHPRAPIRELLRGPFAGRLRTAATIGFLAAAFFSVGLAFATERLVNDLGLGTGTAVGISLAGGIIGGVGFFAGGWMADEWGRRLATVVALLAAVAGAMGLYWLSEPWQLMASVVVSSFGSFAFVPAGSAHRAELFPTAVRATAQTASTILAMLGSTAGLLVGTFTIDTIGLSETVTGLGLGAVLAAALTLSLPETRGQDLETVEPDQ